MAQLIPSYGHHPSLEIATWNLNWLGNTEPGYGPSNDTLQLDWVVRVLDSTDIDIWCLTEVSDSNYFKTLLKKLPQYSGNLSSPYNRQNTAVLFKKSLYKLISKETLSLSDPSQFSAGRLPMLFKLHALKTGWPDTLNLITLHLKSNIGTEAQKLAAYNSRKKSGDWLLNFLKTEHLNSYCVVAGDWNDDLDLSIYNQLPSPFAPLVNNTEGFYFPTYTLSKAKISSTVHYPETIDHILLSPSLKAYFHSDSAFIIPLSEKINQYDKVCSDHYPVVVNSNPTLSIEPTKTNEAVLIQYVSNSQIRIESLQKSELMIVDLQGKTLASKIMDSGNIWFPPLIPGFYIIRIISSHHKFVSKVLIYE